MPYNAFLVPQPLQLHGRIHLLTYRLKTGALGSGVGKQCKISGQLHPTLNNYIQCPISAAALALLLPNYRAATRVLVS